MAQNVGQNSPTQPTPQESVSYNRDQSPIWNLFDKARGMFSNRTTAIASILVLVLGVGAGIIAVQRSTEFRQQAASCNLGSCTGSPPAKCTSDSTKILYCQNGCWQSASCGGSNTCATDSNNNASCKPPCSIGSCSPGTSACANNNARNCADGCWQETTCGSGKACQSTGTSAWCYATGTPSGCQTDNDCPSQTTCIGSSNNNSLGTFCLPFNAGANNSYCGTPSGAPNNTACQSVYCNPSTLKCDASQSPPPPQATGTITATPKTCTIPPGQTSCSTKITWTASNATYPAVCIDGELFTDNHWDQYATANWITAGKNFVFRLYNNGCNSSELASVTVTANSPPQATGTIQGYKVLMPGNRANSTSPPSTSVIDSQTVSVDNPASQTSTSNSYGFTVDTSGHYVSVSVPSGYTIGYTLCYSTQVNCGAAGDPSGYHSVAPTPGSGVMVTVPGGGSADLWWHYLPPVAGHVKNSVTGAGISGVQIQVYDNNLVQTQYPTTDANGNWSVPGFVRAGDDYAVRVTGNLANPKTAPSGYSPPAKSITSDYSNNICAGRNTISTDGAYECQRAGSNNDCAGPNGPNGIGIIQRCDFAYDPTPPTIPADIDRDGFVKIDDFSLWLGAFKGTYSPPYTYNGKPFYPDVNGKDGVTIVDFSLWLAAFKQAQ